MSIGAGDVRAGGAYILLTIRDQTVRGLELARRRLRGFALSANAIGSRAGAGLFGPTFLQTPLARLRDFRRSLFRIRRNVGFLQRGFGRLGANIGTAFGGLLGGLILSRPIRDFSSLEQLLGRFDAVFRGLRGQASGFVDELAIAINQSPLQLRDISSQFQAFFQGLDFEQEFSFGLTQAFTELSQDTLAFRDDITSAQEAVDLLLGGAAGSNVRGVRRTFGANVLLETLQEVIDSGKLIEEFGPQVENLSEQQQRVLARVFQIVQAAGRSGVTGQAIREVNTLASAFRAIRGEAQLASAIVGQSLGRAVSDVTLLVVDQVRAFREWSTANQGLTAILYGTVTAIGAVGVAMAGLAVSTFILSATFGQLSTLLAIVLSPVRLLTRALVSLGRAISVLGLVAFTALQLAISATLGAVSLLVNGLRLAVIGVFAVAASIGAGIVTAFRLLTTLVRNVPTLIFNAINAVGNFGSAVTRAFNSAVQSVANLITALTSVVSGFATTFQAASNFLGVFGGIAVTASQILVAFAPLISFVIIAKTIVLALGAIIPVAIGLFQIVRGIGTLLADVAREAIVFGVTFVNAFTAAAGEVANFGGELFSRIREGFTDVVNQVVIDARNFIDAIESALQAGDIGLVADVITSAFRVQWLELTVFMLQLWEDLGPRLQATFDVVFEVIGEAWLRLIGQLGAAFNEFLLTIRAGISAISGFLGPAAQVAADAAFKGAADVIAGAGQRAQEAFNNAAGQATTTAQIQQRIEQRTQELLVEQAQQRQERAQRSAAAIQSAEEKLQAARETGNDNIIRLAERRLQRAQQSATAVGLAERRLAEARAEFEVLQGTAALLAAENTQAQIPREPPRRPEAPGGAADLSGAISNLQNVAFGGNQALSQILSPQVTIKELTEKLVDLNEEGNETLESIDDKITGATLVHPAG